MQIKLPTSRQKPPGLPPDLRAMRDELADLLLGAATTEDVFAWLEERVGDSRDALRIMLASVPPDSVFDAICGAVPPYDEEAEQAVVSMLLCYVGDPRRRDEVSRIVTGLRVDDFHSVPTRTLFDAVRAGLESGKEFDDDEQLYRWLTRRREGGSYADLLGGDDPARVDPDKNGNWRIMPRWLAVIAEACGAWWFGGHLEYYIRRLRQLGAARRCVRASWALLNTAWREERRPEKWAEAARQYAEEIETCITTEEQQ